MNNRQSIVLFVTAATVTLMVLFPPYIITNVRGIKILAGYGFILDLPVLITSSGGQIVSVINLPNLAVQVIGFLIVSGLVFFAFNKKE